MINSLNFFFWRNFIEKEVSVFPIYKETIKRLKPRLGYLRLPTLCMTDYKFENVPDILF